MATRKQYVPVDPTATEGCRHTAAALQCTVSTTENACSLGPGNSGMAITKQWEDKQ